eukprot:COSAG05_NODE_24926_length_199_cov_16.060000_1_plen_47_part_10
MNRSCLWQWSVIITMNPEDKCVMNPDDFAFIGTVPLQIPFLSLLVLV